MSKKMTAAVVTVSDSASAGTRQDLSGPTAVRLLAEQGFVAGDPVVVPDERERISAALREAAARVDLVVTTGGTGLAARDATPEATRDVLEREAPGLSELMRARGLASTPTAALSRGVAGVVGQCLVVNLPGSPKAVEEGLAALRPVLPHAIALLRGQTDH